MSQKHEDITNALSEEARRALIDTPEGGPVAVPPGPLGPVVRQELARAGLWAANNRLTTRGEVVRYYVIEKSLEDLG